MAAPKPPKSKAGFASRLTAKAGPLPVWAWAAVILGAYFLYTRLHTSSTTSTTTAATTDNTSGTDSAANVPASGQGSPADNLNSGLLDALGANSSSLDALTSQLINTQSAAPNVGDAPAAGDTGVNQTAPGPAAAPTTTQTTHPAQTGAPPAAHPTQTTAGKLSWGGLTFTSKAAFNSWATAHGSSASKELNNHPQAKAIYSTLK